MTNDIHDLAAPYALDALGIDERERFEAHLEHCSDCTAQVLDIREAAAAIAMASAGAAPESLRSAVFAAIADEPQERFARDTATERTGMKLKDRLAGSGVGLSRRMGAAAAMAAVVLVAVAVTLTMTDGLTPAEVAGAPDAVAITLPNTEAYLASGVSARIEFSPGQAAAVAIFEGLAGVPGDATYQLWVIDGTGPTPAGVFVPDAAGLATVLLDASVGTGDTIGVTVEPTGGSPAPTGDVLFAATV